MRLPWFIVMLLSEERQEKHYRNHWRKQDDAFVGGMYDDRLYWIRFGDKHPDMDLDIVTNSKKTMKEFILPEMANRGLFTHIWDNPMTPQQQKIIGDYLSERLDPES